MSFFRTHRAQTLRSRVCGSSDLAVCNAFRRLGDMVFHEHAPAAPILDSYSVFGTTVSIAFTPGVDGVTNYEYSIDGGVTFTPFSPVVTVSPVTITGLTVGASYPIQLRAVNLIGRGASSAVLLVVIPTVPDAPTELTSTTSDSSATISFSPGSDRGSVVINYQYSINGGATFTAFSPATGPADAVTITGLTNGSTYPIQIRAVNLIGNGVASSTLSVALPAVAPSAPSGLSASSIGTKSFTVSFTPGSTGGSPITNYEYSLDGGSTFTACSPVDTASPITISSGVSAHTTYSVVVKAVNAIGLGAASPALSVTTAKLEGSLLFNGSNKLTLSPGASVGGGAYTVECWFYNNNAWGTTAPNYAGLLGCDSNGATANGLSIYFGGSRIIATDKNGGGLRPSYTMPSDITLNAWHHFVLVRNSNHIETVFIDGVKAIGSSATGNQTNTGEYTNMGDYSGVSDEIGHFYQGYWHGYLANFRIVAGVAVYDPTAASITVPTADLTAVSGTQYLIVGDTVVHDGASLQTITNTGNVTLSSTVVPF